MAISSPHYALEKNRIDRTAHRTAEQDPRLHPVRDQGPQLPAERARDRRGGRPELQLDRPQPPQPARAAGRGLTRTPPMPPAPPRPRPPEHPAAALSPPPA